LTREVLMPIRRLVIVRRNEFATFARLSQTFANEPNVRLLWDRRTGDRRQSAAPAPLDRRRRDRRKGPTLWGPDDFLLLTISQDDPEGPCALLNGQQELVVSDDVRRDVEAARVSDLNVLVSGGEAPTRNSLAHWIHRQSRAADSRFAIVDPETFTELFARADSPAASREGALGAGTLLIEEIADWTLVQQTQLLHFLDWMNGCGRSLTRGQRATRLISGTGCWLMDRVTLNQFREDLFYRLNVIHLVLPGVAPR
jgi:transcriptional regulator of acetoin/glycerol metabolism